MERYCNMSARASLEFGEQHGDRRRPAPRAERGSGSSASKLAVGIQIVSCELDHTVPATRPVHFSRTFVGELGRGVEPRSLSHCLGSA